MMDHEPHYLCGTCGYDRGPLPPGDLRLHPNGGIVCDCCWAARYGEWPGQIDFASLPVFAPATPASVKRVAGLIKTIADHEATIETYRLEVALLRQVSSGVRVSAPLPYHTSDCAIHDAPAGSPGACDCGGPHVV